MPSIDIQTILPANTWPIRQAVMWPDKNLDYVQLPDDANGIHFGLYTDQQLVSVVSLFIQESKAQFRKFATLTTEQGKGYGSQLLTYLISTATQYPISILWCNARTSKAAFYEKFGFIQTSRAFVKDGISYVVMEKHLPPLA